MQRISNELGPYELYDPKNPEHDDPSKYEKTGSTVIGHILACLTSSRSKNPVVNLGILFHDLGKAVTRGTKANGHSNYHGHESAGVPITQQIFERLRFCDLASEDREAILFAVARHMLIHNLDKLKTGTLVKLILNPGWEVLKDVSFADEASRFIDEGFNPSEFNEKIARAEARVHRLGNTSEELRVNIKKFVDGNKLKDWFEAVRDNPKLIKPILDGVKEFIIEKLDKNIELSEKDIFNKCAKILKNETL